MSDTPKKAVVARRWITFRLVISLVLIGVVGYSLCLAIEEKVFNRPTITIRARVVKGVRPGIQVVSWPSENLLGRVRSLSYPQEELCDLHVEINKDNPLTKKFYTHELIIETLRFEIPRGTLRIINPDMLIGPKYTVRFGDELEQHRSPDNPEELIFEASFDQPPMRGITEKSLKRTVRFHRDMHNLRKGNLVKDDLGMPIGQVWKVTRRIDYVDVEIAFLDLPNIGSYANREADFYLDRPEFSIQGSNGSPESLLLGSPIKCFPDRMFEPSKYEVIPENEILIGENGPPRKYKSVRGEQEIFLESTFPVNEDVAVVHDNQDIGRVFGSVKSDDGLSYFVCLRILPKCTHLVTTVSKFSKEKQPGITLYDEDPDGLWDAFSKINPQIELTDPQSVVQPRVELFTPPWATRVYDYERTVLLKQLNAPTLYSQPQKEWMNWHYSNVSSELKPFKSLVPMVRVHMEWKAPDGNFLSGKEFEIDGHAIYVQDGQKTGLLGMKDYLSVQGSVDTVKKASFKMLDFETPFIGPSQIFNEHLVFKQVRVNGLKSISIKDLSGTLDSIQPLCILTPQGGVMVIDERRLRRSEGYWSIDRRFVSMDPNLHGYPVYTYDSTTREPKDIVGLLDLERVKNDDDNVIVRSIRIRKIAK